MARPLTFAMEQISNGNASERSPAFRVTVWDIRAGINTVSDVVTDTNVDPTTGPFDISEFTQVVNVEERSGDYITSGVPSSIITGTIEDPDGQFDPDLVINDPTALGRFFRRGNLIRITVGDERVPESEWVDVFTGLFAGQVGYVRGRVPNESQLTFKAYGREATFLQFERTTDEFTNIPTTTYLSMIQSIATNEMGLLAGEISFSNSILQNELKHLSVTLAKENPMAMLAKVMFVGGFLPKFTGSGILTQTSGLVTAGADRFYDTNDGILSIIRPLTEVQPPDAVCIVGLDANLSRINQPRQVVGELNVTTGYFTNGEELEIFWSDDKTQLVDNVIARVIKSVNAGISPIGGENFIPIDAPSELGITPVGTIGFTVEISTGFAPWLVVFLLVVYIVNTAFPNNVVVGGIGASTGFTIAIGSIIAGIALAGALLVMTKVGRGQYVFIGDPFEYVYSEIRECAADVGVNEFDRIEVEVNNHLIDNVIDAQNVAKEQLFRQAARGRPRDVIMLHDLGLEPDDTFELLTDTRRFLVDTISYVLQRGSTQWPVANVKAFEITDNISRAT